MTHLTDRSSLLRRAVRMALAAGVLVASTASAQNAQESERSEPLEEIVVTGFAKVSSNQYSY